MITTKSFCLTPKLYFKIVLSLRLKRIKWLLAFTVIAILTIILFSPRSEIWSYFVLFLLIFYLLLMLFQMGRLAYSKKNKIIFLKRYFKIGPQKITIVIEDGTSSTVKIEHFIKSRKINNFYLLYLTPHQFIFIPESAFKNASDRDWFHKEILTRIQNKKK